MVMSLLERFSLAANHLVLIIFFSDVGILIKAWPFGEGAPELPAVTITLLLGGAPTMTLSTS
jgi:hypothetical protein